MSATDIAEREQQSDASLKDLAAQAAALDLLAQRVAAAKKDVRARLQAGLDAAEKRDGTERIGASLPSGEQVATFSLRKGSVGPVVVDEEAFARWVRNTFPDERWTETRIVRTVRQWKAAELLAEMEAIGLGLGEGGKPVPAKWADPETGEVHDVPGVMVKPTSARTHSITWKKTGRAAVADAWRSGELAEHMRAITAGDGGAA
ncbi:hypothetical protein ACIGW3_11435 [Streptomyces sp. NPDC053499]|uniref:hypothetical protein n=1 Tax=Streptomyces sp. NPDC053499 TaxID=3365707 RepID=UPI0037D12CE3